MKLSKIILENKKYVVREQLDLSEQDVQKLTNAIASKLEEYLDIDNKKILHKSISSAINELLVNNE